MNQNQLSNRNGQKYAEPPRQFFEQNQTLGDLNPIPLQSYPQPYTQPQMDPYAQQSQQQINAAVNQGFAGFGQCYFDASNPNIAKTNVPLKKDSSMHVAIIVATIFLIAGIAGGIFVMQMKAQYLPYGGAAIGLGYIIYAICAVTCSQIRGYITNLKKFDDYKQTYDKMVKGRGYFKFFIECYHYRTSGNRNGRKKIVTHTATENFFPSMSIDESGNVESIKEIKDYVFINYMKKFYFSDPRSQAIVLNAYNAFIANNKRDTHQNESNTFEIEGFEAEVGFCMQGQSPHNSVLFYVFSLLGLALPYACILERSVSRYEINILKKVTY